MKKKNNHHHNKENKNKDDHNNNNYNNNIKNNDYKKNKNDHNNNDKNNKSDILKSLWDKNRQKHAEHECLFVFFSLDSSSADPAAHHFLTHECKTFAAEV